MRIRKLTKEGTMQKEKERDARIVQYYEDIKDGKTRRNKLATLDIDDIRKRTKTMDTKHDLAWETREYTSQLAQHKRFLVKSHWTGISGRIPSDEANPKSDKSRLHREIRLVLPSFYSDEVAAATLTMLKGAKSDDNVNLGKHLKKIESIVSLKKPNTLNGTNLGKISELEQIKVFVKAERSPHLNQVRDAVKNGREHEEVHEGGDETIRHDDD